MQIGPYTLSNRWILAPMAAVSEMPFRRIALELGAALAPTELVSAQGLLRLSPRTLRYLRHDPAIERPYCVQIFGGDAESMAQAARVAKDQGAHVLDINMGCPVPKVTKNSSGSALLCQPLRAGEIVTAMREATGLPVTVKIRSGWDAKSVNCVEVAQVLEQAGAAAVALHARTRAQGYSGRADWSHIRAVKQAVRIPVIGNGDVTSVAGAHQMLDETGCDAVMIGRGALGYPWIFRELCGGPAPSAAERGRLLIRHFDEHLEFVACDRPRDADTERAGVHSFRRHLSWYTHGLRGASAFRAKVNQLESPPQVRETVEAFFSQTELDPAAQGEHELDYRAAYG